jgi:pheromone shutdown-related protein TraB
MPEDSESDPPIAASQSVEDAASQSLSNENARIEHENVHHLKLGEKSVTIIGTAHVSRQSAELVKEVIEAQKPDTVCVELCATRFQAMEQKSAWREMDLVRVIKEKKAFLLMLNFFLASYQRRLAKQFDIVPGQEMIEAIASAKAIDAEICTADREIRTTLTRTWRKMGFFTKGKLFMELVMSSFSNEEITAEDIEEMKHRDTLELLLQEMGDSMPEVKNTLIDERDRYLTERIRTAPGDSIVAVVGAGHVPGMLSYWDKEIAIEELDEIPPKSAFARVWPWVIPAIVMVMVIWGFSRSADQGSMAIGIWIAVNAIPSAIGALIALAHPLSILAGALAAPITSLNPTVNAGMVSGLCEAWLRKPKVLDFESLSEDATHFKGWWHNRVMRVLLVVAFTNIGSSIGTFAAPFLIGLAMGGDTGPPP